MRYVLADSQLGGVIDYYRQFINQPNIAEAVLRWDAGVRVTNIARFERVVVPGDSWQVVFAGTYIHINGMEARLSSDP